MLSVDLIAAARPNLMKVAPLWHAFQRTNDFTPRLIHTGQHYDANLSDAILSDLRLPEPDVHLGVGSGSHAEQTARVMIAYEKIALADRPDWLIVVGDVNSTLACAITAAKLHIPLVHLEAGLRSNDRSMPEEINRLATDAISDVLWTPSQDADENLIAEGCDIGRMSRVGNIMIDSFELVRAAITDAAMPASLGLRRHGYGVVTLHRPSNVDSVATLQACVTALLEAQRQLPLVFPVHPRTKKHLSETGLADQLGRAGILVTEPLSYIEFMSLVQDSAVVITDSGGIQEETTYLGIPCLTLRENTERPITITQGTNRLVTPANLGAVLKTTLAGPASSRARPDRWDGKTAQRCVDDLRNRTRRHA